MQSREEEGGSSERDDRQPRAPGTSSGGKADREAGTEHTAETQRTRKRTRDTRALTDHKECPSYGGQRDRAEQSRAERSERTGDAHRRSGHDTHSMSARETFDSTCVSTHPTLCLVMPRALVFRLRQCGSWRRWPLCSCSPCPRLSRSSLLKPTGRAGRTLGGCGLSLLLRRRRLRVFRHAEEREGGKGKEGKGTAV
jgi:hypothetical protein